MESNSKGQFSVEFFTVLILFVGFAAFFSMRLVGVRPAYIREVRKAIIRSESYRISEVLINDAGSPIDWDTLVGTANEDQINRVGLLDHLQNKTNIISEQKISGFSALCIGDTGYNTVKSLIGTEYNFSIILVDMTVSLVRIDCSAPAFGENAVSTRRLVAFDSGAYGELIVQVW